MNPALFSLLFHKDLRAAVPQMLYLPTEPIVEDLIQMDCRDPESWLFQMLFDDRTRGIHLDEFEGVHGCWTRESGTHFF
jgi:hypothetical protein